MKIQPDNFNRGPGTPKRSEDGMATMLLIGLLAIMMIIVTAESSALFHLHREMKLLEQKQIQRLNASQTNSTGQTPPQRAPAQSTDSK